MLIFLHGEDSFRSYQKLKNLQKEFREKIDPQGINLNYFDCQEEVDFRKIREEISTVPFLAKKKMIVLKNLTQNKDLRKKFLDLIKKREIPQKVILIFYEKEKTNLKDPLFKILSKEKYAYQFDPLKNSQLEKWLKDEIEKRGGKIENRALEKLSQSANNNLWQMENEIEKLVNYKNKETIREKDIELLIKPKISANVFELVEAIARKEKKKSLKLLEDLFDQEENELYLLSMISWQFRNLLKVKSFFALPEAKKDTHSLLSKRNAYPYQNDPSKLGLHPFVLSKTRLLAKNFSLEELKEIYKKLLDLDKKIKKGKINPKLGLFLFLQKLKQ